MSSERGARLWWRIGAAIFAVVSFAALFYSFAMRDRTPEDRTRPDREDESETRRSSNAPSRFAGDRPIAEPRARTEPFDRDAGGWGMTQLAEVDDPARIAPPDERPPLPHTEPAPQESIPQGPAPRPVVELHRENTPEVLLGRTRGLRRVYDQRLTQLRTDREEALAAGDEGRVAFIDRLIERMESQLPTLQARERQYEGLVRRANRAQ